MNERCPESIIYQDESQTLEGAVSCRFVVAQIVLCHSHKQISARGQARVGAARVMASAHRTPNSVYNMSHCSKHWSILNCDKHWHCYTPSPCIAAASNCQHSQIQGIVRLYGLRSAHSRLGRVELYEHTALVHTGH